MKKFKIIILILASLINLSIFGMETTEFGNLSLELKLWIVLSQIPMPTYASINQIDDYREEIENLLKEGANPNCINPSASAYGNTPLGYCISLLDSDLVSLFLKYKANLDLVDPITQESPIHQILSCLEDHKREQKFKDALVSGFSIFNLLLTNGVNLEALNSRGQTALSRCMMLF